MLKRKRAYPVIGYGEWTRPRMKNFREQCCDCGLIHRLDFRIVDTRTGAHARPPGLTIEFRTRRDDRAAGAARRTFASQRMSDDCARPVRAAIEFSEGPSDKCPINSCHPVGFPSRRAGPIGCRRRSRAHRRLVPSIRNTRAGGSRRRS
jgi:hypothetical protein